MEVQILSKKMVKPFVSTATHLRNMSTSFMDQLMAPKTVPFVFYYTANDNYHRVDHADRRKRLEKSLSHLLTLFYPLAGRYIKENLSIDCNDEGVEYTETQVDGQLSEILQEELETKELNRFVPDHAEETATSPLIAIQINIFSCGGLVIGMRFTHRIMDGFTISLFTNGWARACKIGMNDVIVPNFESGVLFPPRDMSRFKFQPILKTKSEVVTRTFVFDAETISKLKDKVMSGSDLNRKPSTTVIMIALIWRAQINAARVKNGRLRNSLLLVSMDLRGKTFKKTPQNCCGNIFTLVTARFQADNNKMGSSDFVNQVSDAIRNSIEEFAKPVEDEDGFFSKVMKPRLEIIEETRKGEGDVHMFSSLINFPFYEVDFGWGKPAWVSMTQRPYKGVSFIGRKGGDGIEAWVSMEEEDMTFFQNDPEIVMSIKKLGSNDGDGVTVAGSQM